MLNTVTDYQIIQSSDINALVGGVKQAISDGWVPSGPLVADDRGPLQVMVRFGSGREGSTNNSPTGERPHRAG
jgi:hypothetical protein